MYNKNLKRLGIILSYLLHPMIISSFTFWYLIYYSNVFIENPNSIFFISFFFSTILPIITVLILKTKNLISDLDASKKGERNLAIRFSEFESIETLNNFSGIVDYVWIDTFLKLPIENKNIPLLNKFKKCLVCPERWGRPEDIKHYQKQLKSYNFEINSVMTSQKYSSLWKNFS